MIGAENCPTCSKESDDTVPVARVMQKLDSYFAKNDLDGALRLLEYWDREARVLNDRRALLEILNEKIGCFRRTGDEEQALLSVQEAFSLIDELCLGESESAATVYLNGATTMKSFHKTIDAMKFYFKAKEIYDRTLSCDDYRLATYYNNISSAYKELGEIEKAEDACFSAISTLEKSSDFLGEIALTHVNLAHLYYDIDNLDERVYEHMDIAWELLSSEKNVHDGHFAFLCSKCYPSFGFFGYFDHENRLKALVEAIYERA